MQQGAPVYLLGVLHWQPEEKVHLGRGVLCAAAMGGSFSSEAEGQGQGGQEQGGTGVAERPSALVVCGPSGVGKGTLIKKLMDGSPLFGFSCSHTTRAPREGEKVLHVGCCESAAPMQAVHWKLKGFSGGGHPGSVTPRPSP